MAPDIVVQLVKVVHEKHIHINELAGGDAAVGFERTKKLLPNYKM